MKLMPWIARLHWKNWRKDRWDYPQLWYCMPRRWARPMRDKPKQSGWGYPLRWFLERLCGWLTGHEHSKTEWGYGGGNMVDHNCRWCDKMMRVPLAESPPPHPALRGIVGSSFGIDPDSGKPL